VARLKAFLSPVLARANFRNVEFAPEDPKVRTLGVALLVTKLLDVAASGLIGSIDTLNAHYGRATIGYAPAGVQNTWKLRREFISPRYTTSWNELLRV
jgi:hypothetical protein